MVLRSSDGQTGDHVMLLSPMIHLEMPRNLLFFFHLWLNDTDNMAALTVYKYSLLQSIEKTLFVASGNHGKMWHDASICLPAGKYKLAFVGTTGFIYTSDIGIGHIVLGEECSYHGDDTVTG